MIQVRGESVCPTGPRFSDHSHLRNSRFCPSTSLLLPRRQLILFWTSVMSATSAPATSNLSFAERAKVPGSEHLSGALPNLSGALPNMLTRRVHILEIRGESYPLKTSKQRRGTRSLSK